MKFSVLTLALAVCAASPAIAQSTAAATTSAAAVQGKTKVNASLASSAKISLDSAKAIARAKADMGEVSSAELELSGQRLVYEVKVLNKSKRATQVTVDAMSGEVVEAKQYGGLKATVMHHKENKKLKNAKADSAKTTP